MEMIKIIKDITGIDPQCNGCNHLKNAPTDAHCYMFKEKLIGCKINTAIQDVKKVKKMYG